MDFDSSFLDGAEPHVGRKILSYPFFSQNHGLVI